MTRNDAAFYVNENGYEIVFDCARFAVIRNGEMRIRFRNSPVSDVEVIRYTDQLERIGILNDADLDRFTDLGEELFEWVFNAWFEIVDKNNWNSDCGVFDELAGAISECKLMNEQEEEN
jgi:hypothetical protein